MKSFKVTSSLTEELFEYKTASMQMDGSQAEIKLPSLYIALFLKVMAPAVVLIPFLFLVIAPGYEEFVGVIEGHNSDNSTFQRSFTSPSTGQPNVPCLLTSQYTCSPCMRAVYLFSSWMSK